jgi:hypothetical protein
MGSFTFFRSLIGGAGPCAPIAAGAPQKKPSETLLMWKNFGSGAFLLKSFFFLNNPNIMFVFTFSNLLLIYFFRTLRGGFGSVPDRDAVRGNQNENAAAGGLPQSEIQKHRSRRYEQA